MVRRRLSLPFTDVKEDDEEITDEEINNWKIRNNINSHDPSAPIQKESENNRQLLKEFVPDMDMLGKEFNSEKNRVKREAYIIFSQPSDLVQINTTMG